MRSLDLFEQRQGVVLPKDLRAYFNRLNGTGAKYEETFIRFTSLAEFTALPALLADWPSASPYHDLLANIPAPEQVFVFADYMFFLFAYATGSPQLRRRKTKSTFSATATINCSAPRSRIF